MIRSEFFSYILILFVVILNACSNKDKSPVTATTSVQNQKVAPIKFDFDDSYQDLWSMVDNFSNEGKYQSALEVIELIYQKANKSKNIAQEIKALDHIVAAKSHFEENYINNEILHLSLLAKKSSFPKKQLIHSLIGELYLKYYQNNQWELSNRTNNSDNDPKEIDTWDAQHILNEGYYHYFQSIHNSDSLAATSIDGFKAILKNGEEKYYPSLLDFLANRFFHVSKNISITFPHSGKVFSLNDPDYLQIGEPFLSKKIETDDTLNKDFHFITVLQLLTQKHLNNIDKTNEKSIYPYLNTEQLRLEFARSKSSSPAKDSLYLVGLDKLLAEFSPIFPNSSILEDIEFNKAYTLYHSAENYLGMHPLVARKSALEICKKAKDQKYSNEIRFIKLKNQITESYSQLLMDNIISPERPAKMHLTYRNLNKVYFHLYAINPLSRYDNYNVNETVNYYATQTIDSTWSIDIKDPSDYIMHSTDIPFSIRKSGNYILFISSSEDMMKASSVSYAEFAVSELRVISNSKENGKVEFYITDAIAGTPINDAKISVYEYTKSYNSYIETLSYKNSTSTNSTGFAEVNTRNKSFKISIEKGSSKFFLPNSYYAYNYSYTPKWHKQTTIFTDRNIYRPGQTIYFKGIHIKRKGNESKILPNETVEVTFYDVNYQEVGKQTVRTNEFGSFSGSFIAPDGGLNGRMRIQTENGSKYINVEEYKRPKFEVEILPIEGQYLLGDSVRATGNAKSYSGAPLTDAMVKYVVKRSRYYFPWMYKWGYYSYDVAETIIHQGTAKTNDKGEFSVDFLALKDQNNTSRFNTYNYQISVDVIDLSGETQSTSQNIKVGSSSFYLNSTLEKNTSIKSKSFAIQPQNLSGQPVDAAGTITVYRLSSELKKLKNRFGFSDLPIIAKADYERYFGWESSPYSQEESAIKSVHSKVEFNTKKDSLIHLDQLKIKEPGNYTLVYESTDKYGNPITLEHSVHIYDESKMEASTNEHLAIIPLTSTVEPGNKAKVLVTSKIHDAIVLYELYRGEKLLERKFLTLNDAQRIIEYDVTEEDRGNLMMQFTLIKNGFIFNQSQQILVPFTNKQLNVELITSRDKMLPGSNEKWKLKITGKQRDKVAAELLLSMYDASLDQFASNSYHMNLYASRSQSYTWTSSLFNSQGSRNKNPSEQITSIYHKPYNFNRQERLFNRLYPYWSNNYAANPFIYESSYHYNIRTAAAYDALDYYADEEQELSEVAVRNEGRLFNVVAGVANANRSVKSEAYSFSVNQANNNESDKTFEDNNREDLSSVKARSNLNETAFFFPHLKTDANGEIIVEFEMPEALTKWKMIGLAHSKDLAIGNITHEAVTQKELMVTPNPPRFVREGDVFTFTSKITNLSEEMLTGNAQLFLFDATTMKPLDQLFNNTQSIKSWELKKGANDVLKWNIKVPSYVGAITYKIVAKAKNHSDGEENSLPVLSNRILVTESLPLPSRGIGSSTFTFEKLVNSKTNGSLKHHQLTLEHTSNPAWYAIQALPYLMEFPHECAEQTFSRYYANAIATTVINQSPKIKEVVESWKNSSPEAFLSNLEKNQELKNIILEETPWVLNAKGEGERKKRVALLFDLNRMDKELTKTLRKLQFMQKSDGGWPWFPGMKSSSYITQHIIAGFGHLKQLGIDDLNSNSVQRMINKGIDYGDESLVKSYHHYMRTYSKDAKGQFISKSIIHYLYGRSYFDVSSSSNNELNKAIEFFTNQMEMHWLDFDIYTQAMTAMYLNRVGKQGTAILIMESLKERSLQNEEMGMYWKDNIAGYYWYQAPIETQAMLIEAFDEIMEDERSVEDMKVWLLKQKQTTDWKTTKATAEACYALLMKGTKILEQSETVEIYLNNELFDPNKLNLKQEAGTSYFKHSWSADQIKPELGKIRINRKTEGVSWGAMYWQYFEDLDKITGHVTNLKLTKKMYKVRMTNAGEVMDEISSTNKLHPGDLIRVKLVLETDRNMEYVHLKDLRAAGVEPTNVLSGYKWSSGFGYYESTKDAATHFFIDYLPKGKYVFEYDLRANLVGNFSSGIASIECMYAPEFKSHSSGIRLTIE